MSYITLFKNFVKSSRGITIGVTLCFVLLFGLNNSEYFFAEGMVETGDLAANGLQIEAAKSFTEYEGPYSRIRFNHPGPLFFYIQAMAESVFSFLPSPIARYQLGTLIGNCLLCLFMWRLFSQQLNSKFSGFITLLFSIWACTSGDINAVQMLTSTWGPYAVIFPMLVFVCCSALVASGAERYAWIMVATATFCIHTHIATIAVVGPLLVVMIISVLLRRMLKLSHQKMNRRETFILAIISVMAIFPLVAQLVNPSLGQLGNTLQTIIKNSQTHHSPSAVLYLVGNLFQHPFVGLGFLERTKIPVGAGISLGIFCLFLVALSFYYIRRKCNATLSWLAVFILLAILLTYIGGLHVQGKLIRYLFSYLPGLWALLFGAAFSLILLKIRVVFVKRAIVTIFLFLALLLLSPRLDTPRTPAWKPFLDKNLSINRQPTVQVLANRLPRQKHLWPTLTGVVLDLRRRGFDVYTLQDWDFLIAHAKHFKGNGKRDVVLLSPQKKINTGLQITLGKTGHIIVSKDLVGDDKLNELWLAEAEALACLEEETPYSFNSKNLIFDGWYPYENNYRWSEGQLCRTYFKTGSDIKSEGGKSIFLKVGARGNQKVRFFLNGAFMKEIDIEGFTERVIELQPDKSGLNFESANVLTIEIPNAKWMPFRDPRILGIRFHEMWVANSESILSP